MRAIFVMIKCDMGQAYRVAREMADGIPELSEMHSISGQYDLLGKFYLEADRDIGLFVVENIQTVPGVKDTYTLQTFNAFSGRGGYGTAPGKGSILRHAFRHNGAHQAGIQRFIGVIADGLIKLGAGLHAPGHVMRAAISFDRAV